jgi:hypothetical protein
VALPRPPQTLQDWQLPDLFGSLGRLHGVQEVEAIFPHHLRIGFPVSLVSGQPHVLDALAIALVPRQGGEPLQPVWGHGGHGVERRTEGFRHEFKTVQHPNGGQHMGGVGALLPAGLEPTHGPTPLQQLVE